MTSLFSWIVRTRWKIRMMRWWYKIWGLTFLGDFKWILHEDFRRNKIRGRCIVSYLIHPNPNLDNEKKSKKIILISYLRNVWSWSNEWECVVSRRRHWEGGIEYRDFASSSDHRCNYIGTMSKETHGDRSLRSEQVGRTTKIESQVEF